MSVSLLDVNVLVALFDASHVHHEPAHDWFGRHRREGWATCPITALGCIRVLSHPRYPTVSATAAQVAERLRAFCLDEHHHFWPDALSMVDAKVFRTSSMASGQQLTDLYLLALAATNHGRLVTFDQAIPLRAVMGATQRSIVVLDG